MAKCPASMNAKKLADLRPMHQETSGGSSETEANELAVMPTSLPPDCAVTTVTPVAKCPRARRKSRSLAVCAGPAGDADAAGFAATDEII